MIYNQDIRFFPFFHFSPNRLRVKALLWLPQDPYIFPKLLSITWSIPIILNSHWADLYTPPDLNKQNNTNICQAYHHFPHCLILPYPQNHSLLIQHNPISLPPSTLHPTPNTAIPPSPSSFLSFQSYKLSPKTSLNFFLACQFPKKNPSCLLPLLPYLGLKFLSEPAKYKDSVETLLDDGSNMKKWKHYLNHNIFLLTLTYTSVVWWYKKLHPTHNWRSFRYSSPPTSHCPWLIIFHCQ